LFFGSYKARFSICVDLIAVYTRLVWLRVDEYTESSGEKQAFIAGCRCITLMTLFIT
jgi:hypothetical protein